MGGSATQTCESSPARVQAPSPSARLLQRKCACGGTAGLDGACEKCRRRLQRGGVPLLVHAALAEPGRPLPERTQQWAEAALGHDFSRIRVHSGPLADRSARAVGARAYTVGSDLVFRAGQYAPDGAPGRRLLAHELTHAVQQSAAASSGPLELGPARDAFEREAERSAAFLERGAAPAVGLRAARQRLQRVLEGEEPAGGCATCRDAQIAGTQAHVRAQALFKAAYGRRVEPEAKYKVQPFNANDKENRRLDLVHIDHSVVPTRVEIGEIKPDNLDGVSAGIEDLKFYRDQLEAILPSAYFEVGFLDFDAPRGTMPFKDNASATCPPQRLSVRKHSVPGLYLYRCEPPGNPPNPCCGEVVPPIPIKVKKTAEKKKPTPFLDYEALAKTFAVGGAAAAIRYAPRLAQLLQPVASAAAETGSAALRVALPAAEAAAEAAAAPAATAVEATVVEAAAAEAPVLAELAAAAGIVTIAAAVTVTEWVAISKFALENVIPGTVGAGLAESYGRIAGGMTKVGRSYKGVVDALSRVYQAQGVDEAKLLTARSDLSSLLRPLHEGVYEAANALEAAAGRFRAIRERITPGDLPKNEVDAIKTLMPGGRYPSPRSPQLDDLAMFMLLAANKLAGLTLKLRDQRDAILRDQSHYVLRD